MPEKNTSPICSEQVQAFCKEKRLSQKELMDVGHLSRTAASHYFNGDHEPRYGVLQKWGVAFGINMNWLFYGEGPMFRDKPEQTENAVALRQQAGNLRLIYGGADGSQPLMTKEIIMQGQTAEAFEAQSRLVDNVCASMARHGANDADILRAILSIVGGAF